MARHPLLVAMKPVASRLGATIVSRKQVTNTDIPLMWEGEVVGGLRLADIHDALSRLIEQVELDLGGDLATLSRTDKQRAVQLLDERGAFLLRRSIEDVADVLGVNRMTVYNYLNAIREPA